MYARQHVSYDGNQRYRTTSQHAVTPLEIWILIVIINSALHTVPTFPQCFTTNIYLLTMYHCLTNEREICGAAIGADASQKYRNSKFHSRPSAPSHPVTSPCDADASAGRTSCAVEMPGG